MKLRFYSNKQCYYGRGPKPEAPAAIPRQTSNGAAAPKGGRGDIQNRFLRGLVPAESAPNYDKRKGRR
jgi:hypothetical protein